MAEERTVSTLTTAQAVKLLMLAAPAELTRIATGGWFRPAGKDRWSLVDIVQGYIKFLREQANTITTKELMAVIGVGKTWLGELEKSGVVKKAGKNAWPRDEVLRNYIAHLRSEKKHTQPSKAAPVSMEMVARHLFVSRERIRQLVTEGVIELLPDGRISLDDARRRYLDHLRNRPVRSQAQDEWRAAKSREVELRLQERMHELVERDAATEVVEDCMATMLLGLQGMPARIGGRDLDLRRKIDGEIYRIRAEAANRIKAHAASLAATGKPARMSFAGPVSAAPSAG